jgi:hypothetical protein
MSQVSQLEVRGKLHYRPRLFIRWGKWHENCNGKNHAEMKTIKGFLNENLTSA